MATKAKIFSLEGKGLKLDTAADVEAHIKPLREMEDVEEVRFLGNTLGVEACKVLGEVLETKKTLQVSLLLLHSCFLSPPIVLTSIRLPTWQIYLQDACLTKFRKHSHRS